DSWAAEILKQFPTYTEISPTGTGLKLFLRGVLPTSNTGARTQEHNRPPGPGYLDKTPGVEAYHSGRYFAVTGHKFGAAPATVCGSGGDLDKWYHRQFAAKPSGATSTS